MGTTETHEAIAEPQSTAPKKEQAPLSREQRRLRERIVNEAKATHQALADKFMSYMVNCDNPDSDEVTDKIKQLNAQWRLYCNNKRLNPPAHTYIQSYCDNLRNEYLLIKSGQLDTATEQNASVSPDGDKKTE